MLEHQPRSFLELSLVYLFHGPKAQDNLPKSALVADISNIDTIRDIVADFLNLPFIYVRPEAKKHGRKNQIEGKIEPNQKVVVIEDLISTGKSSLKAVEALRATGATVLGMAAIFTYDFDVAHKAFQKEKCELLTLSDYDVLLQQAVKSGYITEDQQSLVKSWRKDPENWGKLIKQ